MKRIWKILERYKFFAALLLLNGILLFACPDIGKQSFATSWNNLLEMLSILPPVFILLGLMGVWIPREVMMKYMGKEAGIKGGILAVVLGAFSAGPLYAAFPVAGMLIKKGVAFRNVFLFLGAWSTMKIPMILFEVSQLGSRFAAARFAFNFVGIIILAWIMDKIMSKEEEEYMLQH